jgi:hypothetical protein
MAAASRNVPTRSTFGRVPLTGTDSNSTDPEEIRVLHAQGIQLTPAQYEILIKHADEELDIANDPKATAFIKTWMERKGENLEDKVEELLRNFKEKWDPSSLSDEDIAELNSFGSAIDPVKFSRLSPKSQSKMLKSHAKSVKSGDSLTDEAKYALKKIAYHTAWLAAQGLALGPRGVAKSLQSYPTMKALGSCAVTVAAWAAQQALVNFLYGGIATMGQIAESQCNGTATGGGRRKKTHRRHARKAKRTRRHRR